MDERHHLLGASAPDVTTPERRDEGSILMLAIYYGFILLVAFAPGVLGIPIFGVITLGIPVGILIIIAAFALTGVYVAKANTEFDELNQEILEGTE